ncbi:hypothetical protein [Streptomyces mayteni]
MLDPGFDKADVERLNEEFGPGGRPDPTEILAYLAGLEAITESVYGGTHLHPSRELTPTERAFLEKFYDALDPHTLGALGRDGEGVPVSARDRVAIAEGWGRLDPGRFEKFAWLARE